MLPLLLVLTLPQDPAPLIEKLRSDELEKRDAAQRELVQLGEPALEGLKKASEAERDPDVVGRLKSVIALIQKHTRYGSANGEWTLSIVYDPPPSIAGGEVVAGGWYAALHGDGTGLVQIHGEKDAIYWLGPDKQQLRRTIDAVLAANLLETDFRQEADLRGALNHWTILFNAGAEKRIITIFHVDALPQEIKRVYKILKGVVEKPRDYGGRELADVVADLNGPNADAAEKLLRSCGGSLVVTRLKEAREATKDEAAAARIARLIRELEGKNEAEELHKKMVEALSKATTLQLKYHFKMNDSAKKDFSGVLLLGEGGKLRLEFNGVENGKKGAGRVVSDGAKVEIVAEGASDATKSDTPSKLREELAAAFVRSGMSGLLYDAIVPRLVEQKEPMQVKFEPEGFKLGESEKIGSRDARVIRFDAKYTYGRQRPDSASIALWLDAETHLPVKRVIAFHYGRDITLTETYEDIKANEKIEAARFELSK